MTSRVANHELRNAVTASRMRAFVTDAPHDVSHPLELPLYEGGDGFADFSAPFFCPRALRIERPRSVIEKMLAPLAALAQKHAGAMPEKWTYEWYYLERLDRDRVLRPLFWLSAEQLYRYHEDTRPKRLLGQTVVEHEGQQVPLEMVEAAPYPRQLRTMDFLDAAPGDGSGTDQQDREEWREWFAGTFRAHEREWLASGDLLWRAGGPWLQHLAFDEDLYQQESFRAAPDPYWSQSDRPYNWRWWFQAGAPGLYWRMVPVYDSRRKGTLWTAMQYALFVTSVLNPEATREQDPALWHQLERRFPQPPQHVNRYEHRVQLREQKVLEWALQGRSLDETADLLIGAGLHPLPRGLHPKPPPAPGSDAWGKLFDGARTAAGRCRTRLRRAGQLPPGKPGRPKKKASD